MNEKKFLSTFEAFCEEQSGFLSGLIRKFIPGELQTKKNGGTCQLYIRCRGMKREYLHVANRPLGRELALKRWIEANLADSLARRDLCRMMQKEMNDTPDETQALMQDTDFMQLLEEALRILRENGSFFTQAEWDDLVHGNVDAQFLRLAPEEYRRIAQHARHARTASRRVGNEPVEYPTSQEDRRTAEIRSALYRNGRDLLKTAETDEIIRQWLSEDYPCNPYRRENLVHMTWYGEKFRSKLEAHAAELLKRLRIPYRYEQRLVLGGRTVYPDFILMHPVTHELIILEIFGMMSDAAYKAEAISKINLYLKNHYRMGRTLLYYCEYEDQPLDFEKMQMDLAYLIRA